MNLLSENDWKAISVALRRMEELTFTRTLGDTELTVCVKEAGKAWPVGMVVQVRVREGGIEWVQTFKGAKELMDCLEK